jgi:PRTRC genetic system protein C
MADKAEGKRIFIYEGKEYPDPDPEKTPDEVRQAWTDFFPEISNAEIKETKKGKNITIEFKKRVGTKG